MKMAQLNVVVFLLLLLSNITTASTEFTPNENCLETVQKQRFYIAMQQCEYEAEKGDAVAAELLGFMYLKGKGGPRDWNLARRYLEQSINFGNIKASRYLAVIYWNGLGVPKDEEKAKKLFNDCLTYEKNADNSCAVQYAKTLSYNTNSLDNREKALEIYQNLIDNEAYEYSYNLAKVALSLKKYNLAYRQSEFFLLWAKRYGNLPVLRTKFYEAEKVSTKASKKISPEELSLGSSWIKARIMDINRAYIKQIDDK